MKIFGSVGTNPRFVARIWVILARILGYWLFTEGSILALAEIKGGRVRSWEQVLSEDLRWHSDLGYLSRVLGCS